MIPAPSRFGYPEASDDQSRAFDSDGFLVVADAIPLRDLDRLRQAAEHLVRERAALAKD